MVTTTPPPQGNVTCEYHDEGEVICNDIVYKHGSVSYITK